jgi:hypothetical protein
MKISTPAAVLAALVGIGSTLSPSTAGATTVCAYNTYFGGGVCFDDMTLEECNAHWSGVYVCFMEEAMIAGGRTGAPVLQRSNGEAALLINGKQIPIHVATPESTKALLALVRKRDPKTVDKAALQKAFEAAYKGGNPKVDDATARALSQQFKVRIETEKR